MPDNISRAEFEAFKATLPSRGEIDGMNRRLDTVEKSLKETRGLHFGLKDDVRDWQGNDQTDSELLKASIKPLFREDEKGTPFIIQLQDYPETKKVTNRLWLLFKIGSGVTLVMGTIIGLIAKFG